VRIRSPFVPTSNQLATALADRGSISVQTEMEERATSSSQTPYRSLPAKAESSRIPLFVLSTADPLRWALPGPEAAFGNQGAHASFMFCLWSALRTVFCLPRSQPSGLRRERPNADALMFRPLGGAVLSPAGGNSLRQGLRPATSLGEGGY
jgi:hypothetical protein